MKTLKTLQFLGKTLFVVLLIHLSSCSEEDISKCHDLEVACENLLAKIEQIEHPDEKERYRQLYLVAKDALQDCYEKK